MLTIKLPKGYYSEDDKIYSASKVKIYPGVSILVGCNGSGKTTLLQIIQEYCEDTDIPCFSYDNLSSGGETARRQNLWSGNISDLATSMISSEGENIYQNFCSKLPTLGRFMSKQTDVDKVVILIDALDSGGSLDNIVEIKDLFNPIISTSKLRRLTS